MRESKIHDMLAKMPTEMKGYMIRLDEVTDLASAAQECNDSQETIFAAGIMTNAPEILVAGILQVLAPFMDPTNPPVVQTWDDAPKPRIEDLN